MELYLVQHGEAMSEAENPERPLTARGRMEAERVAAATARIGLKPGEIRHSGKRRAAETAEIFANALGLSDRVRSAAGLAPNDDVRPLASSLAAAASPLMLVGHLPFLSRLASLLVTGEADRPIIRFRMGGIVCLARDETSAAWSVGWVLTPETVAAA
jgi:phosphohistidine phosphatase